MTDTYRLTKIRSVLTILKRLRITVVKIVPVKDAWYLETTRGIIRLSDFGIETFGGYPKLVNYKIYFTMSDNSIVNTLIRR